MPKNPIFELFEQICMELSARPDSIIAESDIDANLITDLKERFDETDSAAVFGRSIRAIREHFQARGGDLPFSFDESTREFQATDQRYVDFIATVVSRRGAGKSSRKFEIEITERLCHRLTGALHRVGWPRTKKKKRIAYKDYLKGLGFDENALGRNDRDGGFDILWLPPLGAVPIRPVISIQCKNSSYDENDANASVGRASRTLNRHSYVRGHQIHFVVFNDYIDYTYHERARALAFVPLGLSDLGTARESVEKHVL
jgi:hypothetical protein